MRERFGLVHALRGVASIWVVLFHASEGGHIDRLKTSIPFWTRGLFELGDNGVAIFFALSGFVIAHSLRDQEIDWEYLGRFALRRSIRLDPPLWASMALVIAAVALSTFVKGEAFIPPSASQIASNATYTQIFLGFASINPVYWTLCYEVQFYLALCLFVMAAQRIGNVAYVAMFAIAALLGTGLLESPFTGLFVDLWHCFFLGVLAYHAHNNRAMLWVFGALIGILLLAGVNTFTLVSILTAAGLYAARRTGFITNGFSCRPLMFLGTISYSLYLTHNPVTGASFFVLAMIGLPQWAALLTSVAACIVVAWVFWWAIERPSLQLAHRIKLRRTAPVSAAMLPAE